MKKKCFLRQGDIYKKNGTFLTQNYIIQTNTEIYLSIHYLKPKILNANLCTFKYKAN